MGEGGGGGGGATCGGGGGGGATCGGGGGGRGLCGSPPCGGVLFSACCVPLLNMFALEGVSVAVRG